MARYANIVLMLAVLFVTVMSPSSASATLTSAAPAVLIDTVPVGTRLLAAQLLEDMRNTAQAPNWDNSADFAPDVFPLYRPDVKDVAYFEFIVRLGGSKPAGFIIVSTGGHDYPIPHWSSSGLSPTEELDAIAKTQSVLLSKYYRLDSLSYAGEDDTGKLVSNRDLPPKINGLDPAAADQPDSATNWSPASPDETKIDPLNWQKTAAGPQSAGWTFSAWGSWSELKSGYGAAYARLIAQLAGRASPAWNMLNNISLYGERLTKGDLRSLAVLCSTPSDIQVNGDGKSAVTATLVARAGLNPLYQIAVNQDQPGVDLPLDVQITCPNNVIATYHYIISHSYYIMLPLLSTAGTNPAAISPAAALPQPASMNLVTNWTPLYYYWSFNGMTDAPVFNQMDPYTSYNSTSCHSGCGATAWAMLFGWADYQARSSNWWTYWRPRNMIYQTNGLYHTTDAVAPIFAPDASINLITWEIRNDIHTFCWGDSGATAPWDMSEAYHYLALRTGTRLESRYNIFGASDDGLRDRVANSIINRRTPAVIGTGWFSHYPLAMGYAQRSNTWRDIFGGWHTDYQRYFWVDQGWGGGGNGWITADTWFAGEIFP